MLSWRFEYAVNLLANKCISNESYKNGGKIDFDFTTLSCSSDDNSKSSSPKLNLKDRIRKSYIERTADN
jgi:hypothetical protein